MRKFYLGSDEKLGNGLYAARNLRAGERVVVFRGKEFIVEKCSQLPPEQLDTALQVGPKLWIYSKMGRYLNHSCDPNCIPSGSRVLIAKRGIKKHEQITFDYSGTYDSDWRMRCHCGARGCRKWVEPWSKLSAKVQKKLLAEQAVSAWLLSE